MLSDFIFHYCDVLMLVKLLSDKFLHDNFSTEILQEVLRNLLDPEWHHESWMNHIYIFCIMKSTNLLEKRRQETYQNQTCWAAFWPPYILETVKAINNLLGYYMYIKRILQEFNIEEKKSLKLVEKIKAPLSNQKTPLLAPLGFLFLLDISD